MTRKLFFSSRLFILTAALGAVALLTLAACGGDDDDDDRADGEATTAAEAEAEASNGEPIATGTASNGRPVMPLPTAVADDQPLFAAASSTQQLLPTAADFEEMDTTEVNGEEGVSLQTLAEALGAPAEATVTIEGFMEGAGERRFARGVLAEIGESTIFVLEDGRVRIVSTSLPEEQILDAVSVVNIQ